MAVWATLKHEGGGSERKKKKKKKETRDAASPKRNPPRTKQQLLILHRDTAEKNKRHTRAQLWSATTNGGQRLSLLWTFPGRNACFIVHARFMLHVTHDDTQNDESTNLLNQTWTATMTLVVSIVLYVGQKTKSTKRRNKLTNKRTNERTTAAQRKRRPSHLCVITSTNAKHYTHMY